METQHSTLPSSLPVREAGGIAEAQSAGYRIGKRLFDVVFAMAGLLVFLPFGAVIGLLIKLEDGGKVFYRQKRVGKGGKPFFIWKFRSMIPDADKQGALVTRQGDSRATRVGRVLRRIKADELPQLWNVLAGEMSFVGPRPEVPKYVDLYTPEQREILQLKPGITDMASMLFRNEESLLAGCEDVEGFYLQHCVPKKVQLNLQYARRASVLQDTWIILQTLCPYWLGVSFIYAAALVAGLWLSYQLRFDFQATADDDAQFKRSLPWMVLPQLILLLWQGQARGLLSYFSIPEMLRTLLALGMAAAAQIGLAWLFLGKDAPGRAIFIMDFVLSFFVLCAIRMTVRLLREQSSNGAPAIPARKQRVAIIGAGDFATNLARDLGRGGKNGRSVVVAFFDDDPRAWQKRPHDVPVVGMPECLLSLHWQSQIDEVIVTVPEEQAARIAEIREMLKGLPMKVTFASGWPEMRPPQA